MKVTTPQGLYLQKFDVEFITENIEKIPQSFKNELALIKNQKPINTRDNFAFVGPFADPKSTHWLNGLYFIVNYADYIGVPPKVINRQAKKLQHSLISFIQTYNEIPEKEIYRPAYEFQVGSERHRIRSLEYMRDHRSYKIEFEFPEGYKPILPPQTTEKKGFFARFLNLRAP